VGHWILRRAALLLGLGALIVGATLPAGAAAPAPSSSHRRVVVPPSTSRVPAVRPGPHRSLIVQRPDAPISRAPAPRSTTAQRPAAAVGGAWTSIGPTPIVGSESCCNTNPLSPIATYGNVSGRVTSIATDPANGAIVYAGTAGGGVWKSTDGGVRWISTSAGQASIVGAQGASAIGALAIDPTNSQIVYAGTGEDNMSDSQAGWGLLKTTDGGTTWTNIGSFPLARQHIGGLVVDKLNHLRVFAATDIGLYVSTDAGATWSQVTLPAPVNIPGRTATQAATQIIQDPSNPAKFWVSVTDFCRGDAGDVMTGDGGSNWTLTPIKFTGLASRIGLGISTSGVAYFAAADCTTNDLVDIEKTGNGGTTWNVIWSSPSPFPTGLNNYFNAGGVGQGDYDNVVAIDPFDATGNTVVFGGISALATINGGSSFIDISHVYSGGVVHPDFHAIAFTAHDTLSAGTDGGVWWTNNIGGARGPDAGGGENWTNRNATLGAVQFYSGTALDSSNFLGGAQDNGSSGSFSLPGEAPLPSWQEFLDGDGGYTAIDPSPRSPAIYAEVPFLDIFLGSRNQTAAATSPYDSFVEAGPCRSSFNSGDPACLDPTSFVGPFSMDPTNPNNLLAGTNRVYLTRNGGHESTTGGLSAWSAISGDLTTRTANFTNRDDKLSVVSMGPAGINGPVITGSQYGAVFLTPNGSTASPASWTNITGNLPQPSTSPTLNTYVFPNPWISGAVFNPSNPSEAWATIGGLNVVGSVYHTLNAGAGSRTTWNEISGVAPPSVGNEVINGIALDPTTNSPSAVYIATDTGVMVCDPCIGTQADAGATWQNLGTGLPNVKVNAITFTRDQQNLIAWTHGLGAWSIPASGWQKLGGQLASRPVSPSPAASRIDTFVLGFDKQIWHKWFDGTNWQWEVLPGTVTSDPSAIIAAAGNLDVFARGQDGSLVQNHWVETGGGWTGWRSRGGQLAAEPSAVANGGGEYSVFVKGTDNHLWYWNDITLWHLAGTGGLLKSVPGATVATTRGEFDAFVQGADNHLWYWSSMDGWHGLGGVLAEKPAAISWGGGRLDAFVKGTDQALWHWFTNGGATAGRWEGVGGRFDNRPAAVTLGSPRLDAFVQGLDNTVWHAVSTGTGWRWEQLLGATLITEPSAVAFGANRIDLFIRNNDFSLWHRSLP
jgi:hypothetical protein